jgi:hypothetical protein
MEFRKESKDVSDRACFRTGGFGGIVSSTGLGGSFSSFVSSSASSAVLGRGCRLADFAIEWIGCPGAKDFSPLLSSSLLS